MKSYRNKQRLVGVSAVASLLIFLLVATTHCGRGLFPSVFAPPGGTGDGGNGDDGSGDANNDDDPTPSPPAVTITNVLPSTGARGTTINVSGTGFVTGMTFRLGGSSCFNLTVLSSTTFSCDIGPHRTGTVGGEVTVPGNPTPATFSSLFAYKSFLYVAEVGDSQISIYSIGEDGLPQATALGSYTISAADAYLVLDPRGKFLLAHQPGISELYGFQINPTTGDLTQVLHTTAFGGFVGRLLMHPSGGHLYGSNGNGGLNIATMTIDPLTLIPSVDISNPLADQANWIAADPNGSHIYAAMATSGEARAFYVHEPDLPEVPTGPFGSTNPAAKIAVDHTGQIVFVGLQTSQSLSVFLRSVGGELSGPTNIMLPQAGPFFLTPHPTRNFLYISYPNNNSGEILSYNPTDGVSSFPFSSLSVGGNPQDFVFDADGSHAYIPNYTSATITTYEFQDSGELTLREAKLVGVNPDSLAVD